MSYVVTDIETVPDYDLWQPEPVTPARIKADKEATKGERVFFDLFLTEWRKPEKRIHQLDIEKAIDVIEKLDPASLTAWKVDKTKMTEQLSALVEKEKSPIAPHYAQSPIVIGMVWFDNDLTIKKIGCFSETKYGRDEKKILGAWSEWMAREKPVIVDWNGRGFDLPVLCLRAFRHGVNMGWYYQQTDYRYRYSDKMHADLMDTMTEFGAVNRAGFRLDKIARAIGLPGKYGVDGSMVEKMYQDGKLVDIETYCMTDAIQTAFVYLRQLLVKGQISLETYQKRAETLIVHVGTESRFTEFISLIDQDTLLLASPNQPGVPQQ